MFVWNLPCKERECFDRCLEQGTEGWPLAMPAAIEKSWRSMWTVWVDNPVSVNGKECPLPDADIGVKPRAADALSHLSVVSPADPVDDF
ncbi:hypothetical protein D3C77_577930 [compost metagenome]